MVECQQAVTTVGRNDPGGGLEAHPTLKRTYYAQKLSPLQSERAFFTSVSRTPGRLPFSMMVRILRS